MKKTLLLITIYLVIGIASFAQWGTLAVDGVGDGSNGGANFLDGTKLEYRYDINSDSIWFRVTVNNVLTSNYGINIIMNVTGGGSTANWFGGNSFAYHRVITTWITSGSSGTVGITDAAGFAAMNYTKLGSNNINIKVDATGKTYTLGLKRTDIYNDTALKADIIAGVGSNQYWDDDIPNIGSGGIDISPSVGVRNVYAANNKYSIFPNPSHGVFTINNTSGEPMQMSIYSLEGRELYSVNTSEKRALINLEHLPHGIYTAKMSSSTFSETKIIVIQ